LLPGVEGARSSSIGITLIEKAQNWKAWTKGLGVCLLATMGLASCMVVGGRSVDGRLTDLDTGKPITNAVAYGVWVGTRTSIMRSDGVCAWIESTRVNEQGEFHLPIWWKGGVEAMMTSGIERTVFIYAPGYELQVLSKADASEVKMRRFVGTVDARFRALGTPDCLGDDAQHRLSLVSSMMADEMEFLAITDKQHSQAKGARESANDSAAGR